MRTVTSLVVMVLVLSFVDERYFFGQYTRAVTSIAAQLVHFFYG